MIDTEKLNADGGEDQTEVDALEIEISNEDLSTSDSTAAEEKVQAKTLEDERKKKNRVPAEKRIGGLIRKNHDLTERVQEVETYAQRVARELEEERGKRGVSDKAALGTYVKLADANLKLAKIEHAEAQNSGDADKIADATAKLSAAAAEKANVDNFVERTKTEAKPEGTRTVVDQPEQQRQSAPANLTDEAKRWTEETTWFNPNSDEFDRDKHVAAVNYALVLEKKYRKAGRQDEIGTSPEYFKAIDDFISREFDDEDEAPAANGAERKVPNMQAGRQDNTAVNRSAPAGSNGNGAGKIKVTLSADENDMVRRNMEAGAVVDPKTGKRITDFKVAQQRYAIQKHKLAQQDKQRA